MGPTTYQGDPRRPQQASSDFYEEGPLHPPVLRRRRWSAWKITGLVLLAIGAFLVFVTSLAVVLTPSGTAPDITIGNQGGTSTTASTSTAPRDGSFEFKVGKVTRTSARGRSVLREEAQGVFWVVPVTVRNIGDTPQMWDTTAQFAYDAKGNRYQATTLLADAERNFLEDINPGNSVRGVVVYDVPDGVRLTELELHDSVFSTGVRIKLKS